MKVTVKDIDVLKSLHPQQVAEYLQTHGWEQQQQIAEQASIWRKETGADEKFQLVLPLNQEIASFPVSMSLVLETLEIAENRSQLDILDDLLTSAE